jgi:hypothetical protein
LPLFSSPNSRPYLLAALSLAVLVFGSGILLILLARVGIARRGLV